jgi:membrane protease YdiL (CAAX protease family)
MNTIRTLVKRQPLIAFFVLAFGLTWGAGWAADTFYTGTTLSALLVLPFLLLSPGPLLGALIVTGITGGRAGVMSLLRKFTIWRVGWRWYAVALLLTPAMFLVAIYLNVWLGAPNPTVALLASAPGMLLAFAIRLVNPFDGPMKEELGWRGFALPYLQERHSTPVAYLILIALVVIWHLPLVWMGSLPAIALFGTASATILYGWIFNNTKGSVLMTLITHATDGLIGAGMLGWTGVDSSRFYGVLIAVWCVTALIIVLRYGSTMGRKPVLHLEVAPVGQPLAAK